MEICTQVIYSQEKTVNDWWELGWGRERSRERSKDVMLG